jgi:hypothetical protein
MNTKQHTHKTSGDFKSDTRVHPSTGGTYVRQADGSLKQTEPSTEPHPGKRELAARAALAAKEKPAKRAAAPAATQEGDAK